MLLFAPVCQSVHHALVTEPDQRSINGRLGDVLLTRRNVRSLSIPHLGIEMFGASVTVASKKAYSMISRNISSERLGNVVNVESGSMNFNYARSILVGTQVYSE